MAEKKYLDLEGLSIFAGKLKSTYAPMVHHHDISFIDNLQTALDSKVDTVHIKKKTTDGTTVDKTTKNGEINISAADLGLDDSLIGVTQGSLHVALADNATRAADATNADKLKNKIDISISGGATGKVTGFDGSQNADIAITVKPDQHQHIIDQITGLQAALDAKLDDVLKGAKNGLAELGSDGKVPASQLPTYVDDVMEFATKSDFPPAGGKSYPEFGYEDKVFPESNKIYVDKSTNITYRWSGTMYVKVASDLALGSTSSTAWFGDRGLATETALGDPGDKSSKTAFGKIYLNAQAIAKEAGDRAAADQKIEGDLATTNNAVAGIRADLGATGDTQEKATAFGRIKKLETVQATKADKVTTDALRKDLGTKTAEEDDAFTQIATNKENLAAEVTERKKLNTILTGFGDNGVSAGEGSTSVVDWVKGYSAKKVHTHVSSDITDLTTTIKNSVADRAASADKLNSGTVGLTTKPVYFKDGVPVEIGYSIQTSVPAGAVFTDTKYKDVLPNGKESGLMTPEDKTKLDGVELNANNYKHPDHTAYSDGLYSITVDNLGHVTAAKAASHEQVKKLESKVTLVSGPQGNIENGNASDPYINVLQDGAVAGKVQLAHGDNITISSTGGVITIAATNMRYTHHTQSAIGEPSKPVFHKIYVDTEGHTTASSAVTTADIFGLNAGADNLENKVASQAVVTTVANGLMSAEDKAKLNGITAGAGVVSLEGKKGVLTKADLALDKVNNTPDLEKNVNSAKKLTTGRNINIKVDGVQRATAIFNGSQDIEFDIAIPTISTPEIEALFTNAATEQAVAAMKARRK